MDEENVVGYYISNFAESGGVGAMSEIAKFYGFTVSMDSRFVGSPSILIGYEEEHLEGHYDLDKEEFTDGTFPQSMVRIILEWVNDHILLLKAMWQEKKLTVLPDWE